MPREKYKIRIITDKLSGLSEGEEKTVDKIVAIDMVDRKHAEFVNAEDAEALKAKKKAVADHSNGATEADKKKDPRNLVLGRRKSLLAEYTELVDLESEEFSLTLETTKEEFAAMLDAAKEAKQKAESADPKQILFDERLAELNALKIEGDESEIALTLDTTVEEFEALKEEMKAKFDEWTKSKTEVEKQTVKKPTKPRGSKK